MRVQDGRTLVDRRTLRRREGALNGYLVYEADDLDAAIALAARIPVRPASAAPSRCGSIMEWVSGAVLNEGHDRLFRDHWGRVLAGLVRFLGDFDLAEEAAQEAFAIAAERWPRSTGGRPTRGRGSSPRRGTAPSTASAGISLWTAKATILASQEAVEDSMGIPTARDERLGLVFACFTLPSPWRPRWRFDACVRWAG